MILYLGITIAVLLLSWYAERQIEGSRGGLCGWLRGRVARDDSDTVSSQTVQDAGCVMPRMAPCGSSRRRMTAAFCLLAIYVILLVPAVLRQETGNDYLRYVEFFHLASVDAYVPTEEGFNLLVKAIYFLCSYENYILVFAVFAAATILLFLEAIREETWHQGGHLALTMYLFMMGAYYYQSYNTMRYYLALAAALLAAGYYRRRRYVGFLLIILLASTIHRSVLVVLVLYPAAMHIWRRWQVILVTAFGVSLIALQGFWMKVVIWLYPSYENSEILAQAGSISYRNILRCALILVLVWYVRRLRGGDLDLIAETSENRRLRFYVNATALALWLYVFGYFIPEVSRIGYYLVILQIFLLPQLLGMISEEKAAVRKWLTVAVMLYAAADFMVFLYSAYGSTIKILPYKSWLFRELNETPSRSVE